MHKKITLATIVLIIGALGSTKLLPDNAADENSVLRILPLGDSITHAEINRASYRYPLWKKLIDAGLKFDFVGSMNTQLDTYSKGTPPQPDYKGFSFDPDHEGHFAWEVSDIVTGKTSKKRGSGNIAQWLQHYDFDIALLHLGTNDAFYRQSNAQISAELADVVSALREDNPNGTILLAILIPTSRSQGDKQAVESLNSVLPALAKQLDTKNSRVILVDQFTGFNAQTDTYDGVHPNARGEEKIADRWFQAIMENR